MKVTELLDYENFPSLCLAIGIGGLYYFAYWGARLALLPLIVLLPAILPNGFFSDPVTGERLSVTITVNTVEFMVAAIAVGTVIAILLIYLYREKARFFGSLAIVVYISITEVLLGFRLSSQPPSETWVLVFKLVRPLVVSAVFYAIMVLGIKHTANHRLQRIVAKGGHSR